VEKPLRESLEKLVRGYQATAVVGLNIVVFLVVVNLLIAAAFFVRDAFRDPKGQSPVHEKYQFVDWKRVYPDLDEASVERLMTETWSRSQAYEPFTQFTERPFEGEFVNVIEPGFRLTRNQSPWPPDPAHLNIYLFGGSTTFGYGVPDEQTIASYLQDFLTREASPRVRVYNFGRGMYRSSQERILFEQLVAAGRAPDVAIFVDGLNDFAHPDVPGQTQRLEKVFDSSRGGAGRRLASTLLEALQDLPMARAVRAVTRLTAAAPAGEAKAGEAEERALIQIVLARYRTNKALIEAVANAHSVVPVFVWQPISNYRYDLRFHLFAEGGFWLNRRAPLGYRAMAESLESEPLGPNFLWCADMQEGLKEPLYVDKVHYSARMSRLLAEKIGGLLLERRLLPGLDRTRPAADSAGLTGIAEERINDARLSSPPERHGPHRPAWVKGDS
jgi:lysophospholipase L1-like esterase